VGMSPACWALSSRVLIRFPPYVQSLLVVQGQDMQFQDDSKDRVWWGTCNHHVVRFSGITWVNTKESECALSRVLSPKPKTSHFIHQTGMGNMVCEIIIISNRYYLASSWFPKQVALSRLCNIRAAY
jgi:hypothetical protein